MIYGIEYVTDSRNLQLKVVKFTAEAQAREWAQATGEYAWPHLADESLPQGQQNWHRRIRKIYRMPKGWRCPSRKACLREARMRMYEFATVEKVLEGAIRNAGEELSHDQLV